MKKVMLVLAALCLLGLPVSSFAGEGPMSLPSGSNAGAVKHNKNEAICLDKLGRHGEATMHFRAAKKHAKGNRAILDSPILNGHLGH
jgi:hypothetical protein